MRKIEPLLIVALIVFAIFLCSGARVATISGEDTEDDIQEEILRDDENDTFEAEEYEEYYVDELDELEENNEEDAQSSEDSEDVEAAQEKQGEINEKYLGK